MNDEERAEEIADLREQVARLARQAAADHTGFVESRRSLIAQRDDARARLAAVEALCVTVENRMMATAKPSEIRAALSGPAGKSRA
jgi:hypothetical protein